MRRSIGMVEYSGGVAEDGAPASPAVSSVDALEDLELRDLIYEHAIPMKRYLGVVEDVIGWALMFDQVEHLPEWPGKHFAPGCGVPRQVFWIWHWLEATEYDEVTLAY